jgi:hypothetical protein
MVTLHLFDHTVDHDYYFKLLREEARDTHSIARCSTSHHSLFRAVPRANRTFSTARNPIPCASSKYEASAQKALAAFRADINAENPSTSLTPISVQTLIEHYREKERGPNCRQTRKTQVTCEGHFNQWILPSLGFQPK